MSDSGGSAERVVLRGGYESRLILALVAVVFLTAAIDLLSSPGDAGLPGVLLVLSPVVVLALGVLWLVARTSVVVNDHEVVIRHFASPKTRRIPRTAVVGVKLTECGGLMPAVAPRLQISKESGLPRGRDDTLLWPLVTWTWWRSNTPQRATRLGEQLAQALGL